MRSTFLALTFLATLGLTTAQSSSLSSLVFDTSGLEGQSATASFFTGSTGGATASGASASASSSLSSLVFSTAGVTGSMTIMPTSTAASSSAASASSAVASATRNAQVKLQAGKQEVVGVVGLVAGVLAFVA